MNRPLLPLLAVLALLPVPALAQDKQDAKAWNEALAYYQRFSGSRDAIERKQSADALGDATSEKHDKLCWQLVLALLRAELAKEGVNGRTEEKISGEVLEACLRAFRKLSNKDVILEMMKVAKAKAETGEMASASRVGPMLNLNIGYSF